MPLNTGISAMDLAPSEEMLTNSRERQASQVAQRPSEAVTPQALPVASAGAAPSSVAPKPAPYNPEEGLKQYLKKRFPDMSEDHWNFAKNYYESKRYQHNMKQLGAEHTIALGDYMHDVMETDRAREAVVRHGEKIKMLKEAYEKETNKGTKEVPGIVDPRKIPEIIATGKTLEAAFNAADAKRHENFLKYNKFAESKKLPTLHDESIDRRTLKMMLHHAKHGDADTDESLNELQMLHDTPTE